MEGTVFFDKRALELMDERFGCDTLISLATLNEGEPAVRIVNSYYEKGSFIRLPMLFPIKCIKSGGIRR